MIGQRKRLIKIMAALILLSVLEGCCGPAKTAIPDEPKFRQLEIYPVEGGVCLADEDLGILVRNIEAMKKYQDELRRMLGDLREERR